MIFVTVGSQKFQFNRLLNYIDRLIESGVIVEKVFAQIGYSDYSPKHYSNIEFMSRAEFLDKLTEASVLVTHAGTGTIVNALKQKKKIIAVPRLAEFGEHVDNHQCEITNVFQEKKYILCANNSEELEDAFRKITTFRPEEFVSRNSRYIEEVCKYIEESV